MHENDNDLHDVQLSLQGNGSAYARIVKRYQQELARRLRRFSKDPAIIEELVQNTFVEAYHHLRRYDGRGPLGHWLAVIAMRTGYRYWKSKRAIKQEQEALAAWARTTTAPSIDRLTPDQSASLVDALLAVLPPRDRLIILLTHVEGRSVSEVAELLGWSQTMVKVQAFRARQKLRKCLERCGFNRPPTASELASDDVTAKLIALRPDKGRIDR